MPRVPPVTTATLPVSNSITEFYVIRLGAPKPLVKIDTEMASSPPSILLRQILEERLSQLSVELEGLLDAHVVTQLEHRLGPTVEKATAEARERTRSELADQLNQGARRIRQAIDSADLTAALVDATAPIASAAALLVVNDSTLRGERIRGVAVEQARAFRGLEIPLGSAAALEEATRTAEPVTAETAPAQISTELSVFTGQTEGGRAFIYPLVVRGRAVALLYAWGSVVGPALELLTQLAAAVWTALPAPVELVSIVTDAASPSTDWSTLAPPEQQLHLRAQRFARVQVAQMRLFETDAVQSGRSRQDLYGALRTRIDAARDSFRRSFLVPGSSMVDYLHLELLKTLAHDDPQALGKDYPGPMA